MRQNAYRDECLVTQAIRIALPCRYQGDYPSGKGVPNAVWASIMQFRKGAIVGRPQYRGRGWVEV
jgi:hypothetical protein